MLKHARLDLLLVINVVPTVQFDRHDCSDSDTSANYFQGTDNLTLCQPDLVVFAELGADFPT
jgi:hypothetical protein